MSRTLEVTSLTAGYGGMVAINDMTFFHEQGSVLGVIGPNGAGKSTLLSVLSGAKSPQSGTISLSGTDVTNTAAHVRCRMGICRTHQTPRPFTDYSVKKNVEVGFLFGRRGHALSVHDVLALCGLSDLADQPVGSLRPSELRRLELARAVATGPAVLLVDEVGAGIPSNEIPLLISTLTRLSEADIAVVVVEHVMEVVLQVANRVIVLDRGSIIADGSPEEVVRNPIVVTAYFGATSNPPEEGHV